MIRLENPSLGLPESGQQAPDQHHRCVTQGDVWHGKQLVQHTWASAWPSLLVTDGLRRVSDDEARSGDLPMAPGCRSIRSGCRTSGRSTERPSAITATSGIAKWATPQALRHVERSHLADLGLPGASRGCPLSGGLAEAVTLLRVVLELSKCVGELFA